MRVGEHTGLKQRGILPHFSVRNAYFFHLKLAMFWTDDDSNPPSMQTGAQVPRAFWGVGDAKGGPRGALAWGLPVLHRPDCGKSWGGRVYICMRVCVHLFLICRFRVEENQLAGLTDEQSKTPGVGGCHCQCPHSLSEPNCQRHSYPTAGNGRGPRSPWGCPQNLTV